MTDCWLGVDVGGPRKGFDIALIDDSRVLALAGGLNRDDVVTLVTQHDPAVVGIDSPCRCAPDGDRARDAERLLRRAVCGIRYTPDAAEVRRNPFHSWVMEGLGLFAAMQGRKNLAVEVFPTASFTRWLGPRGSRSRVEWSRLGVTRLGLAGVPTRTNQDQRDALAAAATARLHAQGQTELFGNEIAVPVSRL